MSLLGSLFEPIVNTAGSLCSNIRGKRSKTREITKLFWFYEQALIPPGVTKKEIESEVGAALAPAEYVAKPFLISSGAKNQALLTFAKKAVGYFKKVVHQIYLLRIIILHFILLYVLGFLINLNS